MTVRNVVIHGTRFQLELDSKRPLPPGWRILTYNELLEEEHPFTYRSGDSLDEVARMAVARMRGSR